VLLQHSVVCRQPAVLSWWPVAPSQIRRSTPLKTDSSLIYIVANQLFCALQSRPAEAALLTALLAHDPKRRPAIDDVLRSGLLRKLHAGLTKRPAAATPQPRNSSAAAAAPALPSQTGAAAAAAGSLQHLASSQQRQQATAITLAQQPAAALGKSTAVPAAALAAHLGSGGVLQDFLQLARESVATDAGHLSAQISVLDQVRHRASPLSFSVREVASGLIRLAQLLWDDGCWRMVSGLSCGGQCWWSSSVGRQ
jgi:hypothetical protein